MRRHPPAILVGNAPALDFLNSIATPLDTPIDWIDDGAGFLNWLGQARLVPPDALAAIRAAAPPGELDAVADQARRLREWFRGFVRRHMGRPLPAAALAELDPLNRLLERDATSTQIIRRRPAGNPPFRLQPVRALRSPDALLLPIGQALAQLVCAEDFANVKACEGTTCTLLFADRTRGHARRWCSMAICGNRAKQAAHRHRAKTHHARED